LALRLRPLFGSLARELLASRRAGAARARPRHPAAVAREVRDLAPLQDPVRESAAALLLHVREHGRAVDVLAAANHVPPRPVGAGVDPLDPRQLWGDDGVVDGVEKAGGCDDSGPARTARVLLVRPERIVVPDPPD